MGAVKAKREGIALPRSLQDELQEEATVAARESMIRMLEGMIQDNPERLIRSLTKQDLDWLAVAAISGWVVKRAEQAKEHGTDPAIMISETNYAV